MRYNIINKLIRDNDYKTYLEIGTQADQCLSKIRCEYKVGVDPNPVFHHSKNCDIFYKITSDEFFEQNEIAFDIIFIDGFHHAGQVIRDINHSLLILKEGGTIVVHDCNPQSHAAQTIPESHIPSWNGDVWKAWVWFRMYREDLKMHVIDEDQGCGIISTGRQKRLQTDLEISYENLENNRKKWLNLLQF